MLQQDFQMKSKMADIQREKWILVFQNTIKVCLPEECVFMCFDLTLNLPVWKEYFYPFFRF